MIILILILINVLVIISIYLKYYKFPKNIILEDEKIEDKDSIIIGYINDMGFNNNFDFILAEIIELNIKGYITIEYNKDTIDKYNYKIKQNIDIGSKIINKYEMLVLNFLFCDKDEITKDQLEEKLKNTFTSYNAGFNEIEQILRKKLLEENTIDIIKKNTLDKERKNYIRISIILVILVSILSLFKVLENSLFYMSIYILEIIVSSILLIKSSIYTNKGQILKYNVDRYKINLENKEFLNSQNSMQDIVYNKEFANSLALHINTLAKKTFIDDKITKEATKSAKKAIINVLIIFTIIVLIGIILAKITMLLSIEGAFWLYLAIVIMMACIADITLYKKK